MKKLLFTVVAACATAALLSYGFKNPEPVFLSKDYHVSCAAAETKEMIQLDAANPHFAALHENPKYFKLANATGSMIQFATADGKTASGYFIKSTQKTNKWLLVIQEWWGLNDYIKKEAETFAAELGNYNILAIDMYDGKVATTRDSAMKYMSTAQPERLENIVKGAIAYAGNKSRIYTIGWCFGGGWSLQSTILAGKQAAGCIMYYGRPENNTERLATIQCDVLGFFGTKDQGISNEIVNKFEENMKAAGKNISLYRYEAGHGFANPSNPSYNKEATEDTHAKSIAFLKSH